MADVKHKTISIDGAEPIRPPPRTLSVSAAQKDSRDTAETSRNKKRLPWSFWNTLLPPLYIIFIYPAAHYWTNGKPWHPIEIAVIYTSDPADVYLLTIDKIFFKKMQIRLMKLSKMFGEGDEGKETCSIDKKK